MAKKKCRTSYYQICKVCGKELPLSSFYKDGTSKSGTRYRKECKDCYRKRREELQLAKTYEEHPIKHIGDDEHDNDKR